MSDKWICTECDFISEDIEKLPEATLVVNGQVWMWRVCLECMSADCFTWACWKCDQRGTMGTPTEEHGYVRSCYKHQPECK